MALHPLLPCVAGNNRPWRTFTDTELGPLTA